MRDLIEYFPVRYEDRSSIQSIVKAYKNTAPDRIPVVIVSCIRQETINFRNKKIPKFIFSDGETELAAAAFNPAHRYFVTGSCYFLSGSISYKYNEYQIAISDYEDFDEKELNSLNIGRIVPVYASTRGLTQKKIRYCVAACYARLDSLRYNLPDHIIKKYKLNSKKDNLLTMHFPSSLSKLKAARKQLVYEELYNFQEKMLAQRKKIKTAKEPQRYQKENLTQLLKSKFPFKLTDSQEKALAEIKTDMF
ncbi:MAG TPA: hypothetical protein VKS21_00345, partial [Spirochaetota bacterium]|nr:hypothetical protein [Spirochaetota bacterium]